MADENTIDFTMEQLRDVIKSEVKNLGLEGIDRVESALETLEQSFREHEKRTRKERADHEQEGFTKAALFGGNLNRLSAVKGNEKVFGNGQFEAKELVKALPWLSGLHKSGKEGMPEKSRKAFEALGQKALEASTYSTGGGLIPEEYAADIIGFLHNMSAVRRLGAPTVDISGGKMNMGRQNGTATAYWIGELDAITVSEETFDNVNLDAKKLACLVPISNDLLRRAPAGFEALIRDDLANVARNKEDVAFIRGAGDSNSPKGIKNLVASGQSFAANTTVNLANVTSDLLRAMYKVESANIPMTRTGWMINPRTKFYLMSLRTSDGWLAFMDMLSAGNIYGSPYATTNNISKNLDFTTSGDNDETEIYFGDFAQCVIGQTLSQQLSIMDGAGYNDGSGQVNGFQNDSSVMRLLMEVDFNLRHNTAFSIIEGVDWGKGFDS